MLKAVFSGKNAPGFWEALNIYWACSRLFFAEKWPLNFLVVLLFLKAPSVSSPLRPSIRPHLKAPLHKGVSGPDQNLKGGGLQGLVQPLQSPLLHFSCMQAFQSI